MKKLNLIQKALLIVRLCLTVIAVLYVAGTVARLHELSKDLLS